MEWVDWFNNHRLHTACGGIPPVEHEHIYYRHNPARTADAETPISAELSLH